MDAVTDRSGTPPSRLRRPSWRDSRLLVGLLLVLGSVALGARVVAAADQTSPVYVAAVTLPAGHPVTPADLRVARVRLGDGLARYLSPGPTLPVELVLVRTVGAGELVPRSALGSPAELARRPVAIPLDGPFPAGLRAGALVDIWSSKRQGAAGLPAYRAPQRLASAAEVFAVTGEGSGLDAGRAAVQVLLDPGQLPDVLEALANEARVAIVPVPGTAPPGGSG